MVLIAGWVALFLISLVFHEVCHGIVANWFGDPTAKQAGRLTLNPLKHLDPFWTILLPGLLFLATGGKFAIGMAKPVPVDFSRLENPKQDMILVGAAGPFANLGLAVVLSFFLKRFGGEFLLYAVYFNLGLAVFNLIPIPPLDGSRVLAGFLPGRLAYQYLRVEPYGFLIILFLYFTHSLSHLVIPGINFFCRLLGVPPLEVSF